MSAIEGMRWQSVPSAIHPVTDTEPKGSSVAQENANTRRLDRPFDATEKEGKHYESQRSMRYLTK